MFKDKIRFKDIKAIILFGFAWPVAQIKRIRHKDLWLISERPNEARDNGYWLYKYIKENKPMQEAYYVIDFSSADYEKIKKYGTVIPFNSFSHYVMYLLATKHVSAHVDADSPNSRVSNYLETHGLLKNKRIFLQHGITKDKISFGYYSVSRADLFVCAAKPEYEFCKKEFGYPEGAVQLLGFARFDGLDNTKPKRQILLMPTWRSWLAKQQNETLEKAKQRFVESKYFQKWNELINSSLLAEMLEKYNYTLFFYPHSDMQPFIDCFSVPNSRVYISNARNYDIQELIKSSSVMITDYSSVAFDFAYMEKPLIYYHFDYDEYRRGQHPEGYFSYEKHGFGPVVYEEAELIIELDQILESSACKSLYGERVRNFFDLRDKSNCQRIYEAVKRM